MVFNMRIRYIALLLNVSCILSTNALSVGSSLSPQCRKNNRGRNVVTLFAERQTKAPNRRELVSGLGIVVGSMFLPLSSLAMDEGSIFAPKFVQQYPDFTSSPEGWSFREVAPGKGGTKAALGDRVVFDWSGYTIGYFGRPFQAKGGPQGGAFDKDLDYERTVLGSGKMVKGLESALVGTSTGQILQIVVPFENMLSYPADDLDHNRVGPKPSTFSGQRALNFVLENPRIDRTLLFNVKVIRIDKPNAAGGFSRG